MPFLETDRQRAAGLIMALGVALVVALWPFSTGLIGAPVLLVVMAPLHRWLSRRMPVRVAAAIVIVLGILLIIGPGVSIVGLVATEAQDMATGVIRSPLLARISRIRVGPYQVGAQLEQIGSQIISFIGASALGLIGTATRLGIQLTIAFFGLYFLAVARARDGAGAGRVTFEASVITAIVLLPVAAALEPAILPGSAAGWLALIALAWVSHAGGQGLLSVALGRLPATFSSLVIFLEAVATAAFGWIILGERVTLTQGLGGALILGGIYVARPRNGVVPG